MRRRPSARLLVVDREQRILMFRIAHTKGALAGQSFWVTPGGEVEAGETFEQAAVRELMEETGLQIETAGPQIARKEVVMTLPSGDQVLADERYFFVEAADQPLSREGWTADEVDFMAEHRWWSAHELAATSEIYWPKDLLAILGAVQAHKA